jgi:serine phosphatase RsbU (regulator of sigma subunit)
MIGFAGLSYVNFEPLADDFQEIRNLNLLSFISINASIVFGLLTIYWRSYASIPKRIVFFIIFPVVYGFVDYFVPGFPGNVIFNIFLAIVALEMLRIIIFPLFKRERKEWLISIGFIGLIVVIFLQILIDAEILGPMLGTGIIYVYGILFLSLAVSIDLARNFSQTHQQLVDKEREARENEIEKRVLEADVARKTQELEEARKMQLSMLPKTIPELPNLEIAVYMKTATEVGGDYYDFILSDDNTFTVAVGDATGHGTRAGIMVTLAKSLFKTMGNTFYLPDFFSHCTKMIRRMNLGYLYMALMLVRFRDHKMVTSSAGMPPILIHRGQEKQTEEIIIKGLPLGSSMKFSYQQKNLDLNKGDTILLMSDGLAELFNEKKEMFDSLRIKKLFEENAHKPPQEIIDILSEHAEKWRNGNPQNDDITFVVLRVK